MKINLKINIKNDFFKNSFILIGGTLFAQLFPILLQPILRRILSPEEFGLAAVYFSIVSILTIIASLNYNATIVLPEKDSDSISLVIGSIIISFLFSIIVLFFIIIFDDLIIDFFEVPLAIKKWFILIPISVFLNSCHLILGNWLTRKKEFKKFAINKISRRLSEGIAQISLSNYWSHLSLILGSFIGDLTNFFTYLIQFKKTGGVFNIDKNQIFSNLKRYIHFPKYSLFSNLLSSLGLFMPVIIINGIYNNEITGQFDLSRQILAIPLSLISVSIGQVFLQNVSASKINNQSFKKVYFSVFFWLFLFSISFSIIIFLFGEEIFVFSFGDKWSYAGKLSELFVFSYAIKFCISPLAMTFIALEELRLNSIWQLFYFIGILSLYLLKGLSFESFMLVYIFIDIFFYLCYGLLTFFVISKYEKKRF